MSKSPRSKDQSRSTADLVHEYRALDITILEDEFRSRAEEDSADGYWFFLKNVLQYQHLNEDLHGRICRQVCSEQKKHLILLPRGHLKSSVITIGHPMWRACQDSNRTFAIFNETSDLPVEFMREIRDHWEQNGVLRKYWGHLIPTKEDRSVWKSDALQLKRTLISRTPTFMAKSIIESTAGRHPDEMILDDVISNRTINSPEGIRKSLERFRELQALLEPPEEGNPVKGTMIVIGTRWHFQDLYYYIIENLSEYYEVMVRKAIESGKAIFPEKFSLEILRELRQTMKEWVFSAQMMNEPVDSENASFTPMLLKKATWRGSRTHFLDQVPTNNIMAIDPAFEGSDNFGVIVGCIDATGHKRVLEGIRFRNKPEAAINSCVTLILKWKVHKVFFEAVGGQEWLRKHLVQQLKKSKIHVSVVPVTHHNRNKEIRIVGLVPELHYGRLTIHEECDELREEALHFPRSHDDLLDALEIFSRCGSRPSVREITPNARSHKGTGEYEIAQLEARGQGHSRFPWDTGKVWIE